MLLTPAQFVARIGEEEALQIAGSGTRDERVVNEAKVAEEIATAEAMIAGYVKARYPLAMQAAPELLRGICADLTRYRLRGKGGQQSAMNEVVETRHKDAVAMLRDIASGKMVLEIDGAGGDVADDANQAINRAVLAEFPASTAPDVLRGY